jgi:hypothetical protein
MDLLKVPPQRMGAIRQDVALDFTDFSLTADFEEDFVPRAHSPSSVEKKASLSEEIIVEEIIVGGRHRRHPGDKDDDTMWYAHDRVQRILEPQELLLDRVRQQPEYEREKDTLSGQRYYMNYGFAEEIQPGDEVDE